MLRYESSPGVRTEAWSRGPFWGCDRVGVYKNAIQPMRLHPTPGSHPLTRPLLRRTRAHLAVVRALPDDERGQFSSILALSGNAILDDELMTQDTRSYSDL
jgi:hypothetical protein